MSDGTTPAETGLDPAFVGAVLNALDKHQARALNWGFFDLSITETDIAEILAEALPDQYGRAWEALCEEQGYDASVLASELVGAHLLYADPTRPGRYRTRFAEGVRLLARLRQTFRAHQWATAPALVSDLKVRVAERRFPKREESIDACWGDLRPHCRHPEVQEAALRALAQGRGPEALRFSAFQRRAFSRVLSQYGSGEASGTVVSAGTGAGKTKAFYVPALLGIVADLIDDQRPYTKVIAVYPRNVLLADQLREALSEAAKLRPVLRRAKLRDLTFGALLGDTPPDADAFEAAPGQQSYVERFTEWEWKPDTDGWTIPYLRSPQAADASLVWRTTDRKAGSTALYRLGATSGGPGTEPDVPDGVLRITRAQMRQAPPDVLFLSLEMLNQYLGDPEWGAVFGRDPGGQRPRLLLLDEVHTHEGIGGAQATWVLRRWRYWGGVRHIHVVGLSATLRNAPAHLALLAGLPPGSVAECTPVEGEFETADVDVEYNVVVQGNPAAGTSLLATSIQTAMLVPRLLTPRLAPRGARAGLEDAFFGRKVFGFTDKLDGVNRWLSDLTDAEVNKHLPALRAVPAAGQASPDTLRAMERDGQIWQLPELLGHNLGQALSVTRCSSQDPGATADSDLIVATSSLEVGYDDPDVGATLHHKRPRSMASFIQRKGRAGRRRRMRPWTISVLSAYGADRWAFQNAEVLLAPEVGALSVPVRNAHVLRMQLAYFLLDWMGRRVGQGNPFSYLRPSTSESSARRYATARRRAVDLVRDLIAQGSAWTSLLNHIRGCFAAPVREGGVGLSGEDIEALLWQAPRPLVLEALPELLRKLERNWAIAGGAAEGNRVEDVGARRPLPRHIPSATFAELEAGETVLTFPTVPRKAPEALPVSRALAETVPGNASKRYSVRRGERGYWHPFSSRLVDPNTGPPDRVAVASLFPQRLHVRDIGGISVFEPQVLPVVPVPANLRDTSKGDWVWQIHVETRGEGTDLPVLATPAWRTTIARVVAYLHRDFSRLEVCRYAQACRYEIRDVQGNAHVGRLALSSGGADGEDRAEAVGFRKIVDGLVIHVVDAAGMAMPELHPELVANLRAEYFRDGLRNSERLPADISSFLRDWLWQMSLGMLTATAALNQESLQAAQARLADVRGPAARKVLDSMFQMRDVEVPHGEEEARLRKRLEALWNDPVIVAEVIRLEQRLWQVDGSAGEFEEWTRRRHIATIAQALKAAAVTRVPEVDDDDVAVDVLFDGPHPRIVLSEVESGGVGVMERIVAEVRASPEAFHTAVRHHLSWCPRAELADALGGLARTAIEPGALGDALRGAFSRARQADTLSDVDAAVRELRQAIDAAGYAPSRRTVVAAVSRWLQPGTPAGLERLVADLLSARQNVADALQHWPAPEAFAYYAMQVPALRDRLAELLRAVGQREPEPHQLFAVAQRLLVEGCRDSCPECLDHPNRFTDFGKPARDLTARWLDVAPARVRVDEGDGWRDAARRALLEGGSVVIVAEETRMGGVVPAVQGLLADEVPSGYLLLPISLTAVRRRGPLWEVTLELKERVDAEP
jgi:hypothetical protein